jgi:hypothetical protein
MGFPNTYRERDSTHFAIKAPSQNELNYILRKGFHSYVQVIGYVIYRNAAESGGRVECTTCSFCRSAM